MIFCVSITCCSWFNRMVMQVAGSRPVSAPTSLAQVIKINCPAVFLISIQRMNLGRFNRQSAIFMTIL